MSVFRLTIDLYLELKRIFTRIPMVNKMENIKVLRKGDNGDGVKSLQKKLLDLGLLTDKSQIDGDFGNQTFNAVSRFQSLTGLKSDGVVGKDTWDKLNSTDKLPSPTVQSRMEAIVQVVINACNAPDKGQTPPANIRKYLPVVMRAMAERGLTSKNQLAGVAATIYVELGDWVPREEEDGSVAISQPNGGDQYRGRSFLQITHIDNYRAAGKALELDLVSHPEKLLDPLIGARASILYWVGWLNNTPVAPIAESGDYQNVRSCVNAGSPGKWNICHGKDAFKFAWDYLVENLPEGASPDLTEDLVNVMPPESVVRQVPSIAPLTKWTLDNIVQSASIIPGGNFTWAEATKGGSRMPPDQETLEGIIRVATMAQKARELVGRPFIVTSWYRDPVVNAEVGGVSNSRHINGDAIDFYCDGMTGAEIYNILDPSWEGGLGQYSHYPFLCHIDARLERARWTN